jgi:ADP-ribose pyrophosphatase YjhB (NUDIX family)
MTPKPTLHQRIFLSVVQRSHRWRRAMTLGARVAAINETGKVLLVRHTYSPGWIFPGGGVEFGETCEEAARRELREEAGVEAKGVMHLHGIFSNHHSYRGDHLAFFVTRDFEQQDWRPNREIAAAEFFPLDKLPPDATGGTQRRAAEIFNRQTPGLHW